MIISTAIFAMSLSALAITCAMATVYAQPAAAQTATNLTCNGCVNSQDIKDRGIQAKDLAPGLAFGKTILVRANGVTPGANCSKLRNALANIDDAAPNNPVLIKLERGTYNCGASPLAMKRFVAIEGAGRSATRIFGNVNSPDQGVIKGANDASLHHLTVQHGASGSAAVAISTGGSSMRLSDVAVKVDSATASVVGILANGGSLDLSSVSIQTTADAAQGQGIRGESGAKLNMMNIWVHNSASAGNPAALMLFDSSATGYGVLFSSNFFALLGFGNSVFELVDGTLIGGRGAAGGFTGSFTCVGIAHGDFTARAVDCS